MGLRPAPAGVIFSAVYMLTLYRRTVSGKSPNPKLNDISDMNVDRNWSAGACRWPC